MEDFKKYMEEYKQLPLKEKQSIIIEQLKVLTSLTNKMCQEIGAENEMLITKDEILSETYTEDDFANAVITLVNSIQNSICDFDLKLSDINDQL